jgi:hypothetical protein
MAGACCQFAEKNLQQRIEDSVKLPVVVTRSGTIFVLDSQGKDAKVLSAGDVKDTSVIDTGGLRKRRPIRNRRNIHYKLILRYPQVSAETAEEAMKQLEPEGDKRRFINITIDTGPGGFDWGQLQKYVSGLIPRRDKQPPANKSKDIITVRIEGAISRPTVEQINWITRQGIITRLVLGSAVNHAGDIGGAEATVLKAMSEEGLRVPILYYWAGEQREKVAETLRRALRLNKLSGIGILPYFMSARFDCQGEIPGELLSRFCEVVEFIHKDGFLSEFLEEPVSEIEQRLGGSPEARSSRYVVTPQGGLFSFRQFAFAAVRSEKAALYRPCRGCVWRHICGGVDSPPKIKKKQYKIITDAWCGHRRTLLRQIAGECLEIREHLNRFKDQILETAT